MQYEIRRHIIEKNVPINLIHSKIMLGKQKTNIA